MLKKINLNKKLNSYSCTQLTILLRKRPNQKLLQAYISLNCHKKLVEEFTFINSVCKNLEERPCNGLIKTTYIIKKIKTTRYNICSKFASSNLRELVKENPITSTLWQSYETMSLQYQPK
jgi:hypothetical protein